MNDVFVDSIESVSARLNVDLWLVVIVGFTSACHKVLESVTHFRGESGKKFKTGCRTAEGNGNDANSSAATTMVTAMMEAVVRMMVTSVSKHASAPPTHGSKGLVLAGTMLESVVSMVTVVMEWSSSHTERTS